MYIYTRKCAVAAVETKRLILTRNTRSIIPHRRPRPLSVVTMTVSSLRQSWNPFVCIIQYIRIRQSIISRFRFQNTFVHGQQTFQLVSAAAHASPSCSKPS